MPGFFFPNKVTKFASSFHYYVHYAVLRQKTIFLVNNNNDFAIPFTTFGLEKLHIFLSLLRSLQCEYDKNILFISPLRGLRCKNEKGSCFSSVLPLLLQRHDEETKFLFSFTTLWSQEKEIWFLLHHYLDYDHEKNILVFDSTTTFTMQITPYIYLLRLYVTNLSRKSPSQKNMHNSENFLPQEFQCSLS